MHRAAVFTHGCDVAFHFLCIETRECMLRVGLSMLHADFEQLCTRGPGTDAIQIFGV